jgi:hypothetical protein
MYRDQGWIITRCLSSNYVLLAFGLYFERKENLRRYILVTVSNSSFHVCMHFYKLVTEMVHVSLEMKSQEGNQSRGVEW